MLAELSWGSALLSQLSGFKRALDSRNFALYFSGQGISYLGDGTVAVAFAFASLEITRSAWLLSAVLLTLWLSRLVLIGLAGRLADRHAAVRMAVIGDVVRAGAQLLPAVVFSIGLKSATTLIVSAVLYGLGSALFIPASSRIVPSVARQDALGQSNGLLGVAKAFGGIVGPGLAVLGIDFIGVQGVLYFDSATFVFSALTLSLLRRVLITRHHISDSRRPRVRFRDRFIDFSILRQHRAVALVIAVWCLLEVNLGSYNVLGPRISLDTYHSRAIWATLVTLTSVGGLLGGALGGLMKWRRPAAAILLLIGLAMPVALTLFASGAPVVIVVVAFLVGSTAFSMADVSYDTFVQQTVPSEQLGRISSADAGLTSSARPLGMAICVPISSAIGVAPFFAAVGALLAIAALLGSRLDIARVAVATVQQDGESIDDPTALVPLAKE